MTSVRLPTTLTAVVMGLSSMLAGCDLRTDTQRAVDAKAQDAGAVTQGNIKVKWPDELLSETKSDGTAKKTINLRNAQEVAKAMGVELESAGSNPLLYEIEISTQDGLTKSVQRRIPIYVSNIDQGAGLILALRDMSISGNIGSSFEDRLKAGKAGSLSR